MINLILFWDFYYRIHNNNHKTYLYKYIMDYNTEYLKYQRWSLTFSVVVFLKNE